MDVTDEMRRAVRLQDCAHFGHVFRFSTTIRFTDVPNPNNPAGHGFEALRGRTGGELPTISCTRCEQVWLVIDEPGLDYADAVAKVAERLQGLGPDDVSALTPAETPGFDGVPIPLAPGVSWDGLPESHPAVVAVRRAAEAALLAEMGEGQHEHTHEETS